MDHVEFRGRCMPGMYAAFAFGEGEDVRYKAKMFMIC